MPASGAGRPIRVMLVEDNAAVRRAVAALLTTSADLQVCGEAATAAEAGPLAEATDPDVVIVDLRLPDGTGVKAGRDVRAHDPGIQVLLLTSASREEALVASMLTGAAAFLAKQLLGSDLIGTVRAVAGGTTFVDPADGAAALERLRSPNGDQDGTDDRLLALVAAGGTNREISDELGLDEASVERRLDALASTGGRRTPHLRR